MGLSTSQEMTCDLGIVKVSSRDQKIVYYGNTLIKGWMGVYQLIGDPVLLRFAYQAGIGFKNPQGFGILEVMEA